MFEKMRFAALALFGLAVAPQVIATRQDNILPVAIIGSGCAGLGTAMVIAEYYGDKTFVFGGPHWGGDLNAKTEVGNWLGVPTTYGKDIMHEALRQAQFFKAHILKTTIASVDFKKRPFQLTDTQGKTYYAHRVVIATGTKERPLTLPMNEECRARIFHNWDIHKDLKAFQATVKGQRVAVIGGGIDAMKKASYAARAGATDVHVFVRSARMKVPSWRHRFMKLMPNIHIHYNTSVEKIESQGSSLKLSTNKGEIYDSDFIIVSIGRVPYSDIFKDSVKTTKEGFIEVNPYTFETSVPGVYACGDVTLMPGPSPQGLIAAGQGMTVGTIILEDLLHEDLSSQSEEQK